MPERVSPDAPVKGATLAYLPALDGMRGVAMLGIMGVHAGGYLTAGGFFLLDLEGLHRLRGMWGAARGRHLCAGCPRRGEDIPATPHPAP